MSGKGHNTIIEKTALNGTGKACPWIFFAGGTTFRYMGGNIFRMKFLY